MIHLNVVILLNILLNVVRLQMSEDIDHQASVSRLHVAWYGFHHVDQPVRYELGVGTAPGRDDVVGFVDVDSSSKLLTNLVLQPFEVSQLYVLVIKGVAFV